MIKEFRKRNPTYQRERRFWCALGKIRDAIQADLLSIARLLEALLRRGNRTLAARTGVSRRGQDPFVDALEIADQVAALLDELSSLVGRLEGTAPR